MLAMYYTLRAPNLDPDEICVLAQHVQGAFAYQQQHHQHHPYYQQQHHHHHHSHSQQSASTATAVVATTGAAPSTITAISAITGDTISVATTTTAPVPSAPPAPVVPSAPMLDSYTLQLLWLIGSGAPFRHCYLDSSECILWPKQDTKLLKLLVDAGARLSEKLADEEESGKNALVTSSQVS